MQLFKEYRGLSRETYILSLGRIVTAMGSMVWPMMTMILKIKMHIEADTIATLMTFCSLAMIPLTLLGGKMADHLTRRKIIIVCDIISIMGYLYCAIFELNWTAFAVFIAASLLQSMEGPAYSALVADLTSSADRERAYSLNYLALNLGMILSPSVGGMLFANHLKLLFLINALAIGTSTILIAIGLRHVVNSDAAVFDSPYESGGKGSTLSILKEYPVLILFFIVTSLSWAMYNQQSYLIPLDLSGINGDKGALIYGTMTSLNCIVVVIFTPLWTKWLRNRPEVKKSFFGTFFFFLGFVVFINAKGHQLVYYLAVMIYTWGEILHSLSNEPYLTRRVPATHRGRILGVNTVIQSIIYGLFQIGIGKWYVSLGSRMTWFIVLSILAVALILTIVLLQRDKKVFDQLYVKK